MECDAKLRDSVIRQGVIRQGGRRGPARAGVKLSAMDTLGRLTTSEIRVPVLGDCEPDDFPARTSGFLEACQKVNPATGFELAASLIADAISITESEEA